jgi:hypothetical protein
MYYKRLLLFILVLTLIIGKTGIVFEKQKQNGIIRIKEWYIQSKCTTGDFSPFCFSTQRCKKKEEEKTIIRIN